MATLLEYSENRKNARDTKRALEHAEQASLPENMLSMAVASRAWNGLTVDVTTFHCDGRVAHQFGNDSYARLSVVLDEVGARCEPRLRKDWPCPIGYTPKHMTYAPAGMEVWGYSEDTRYVRDVMLSFNLTELEERLATRFESSVISMPQLRFVDDRVWSLAALLADAATESDPSIQLYGDGLVLAITALVLSRPTTLSTDVKGLAPWQLRRVLEYLDAHLPERVALADLSVLAGLSPWHFSRAFKASTGLAPYRWQLDARIRRAQFLLLETKASLESVAEETGFADAVHFGKTFRRILGATPAAWRKAHRK